MRDIGTIQQAMVQTATTSAPPSTPSSTDSSQESLARTRPGDSSPLSVTFSDCCPVCGFEPGVPGYVRRDLPPGHPDFGRHYIEPCPLCHDKAMAERKRFMQPLEGQLNEHSFENFDDQLNQKALLAAVEFAANPQGILVFWGGNGRGKTHLVAAIHNRLREYGAPARYFSLPDLTSKLRDLVGDDDEGLTPETFYQYVSGFPILLIDDIDYADIRRWTREQMFRLFNRRYINHRQVGTVLAMEFDPNQDGEMRWLFSRINDERMVVVRMEGPDNRPRAGMIQRLLKAKRALVGK